MAEQPLPSLLQSIQALGSGEAKDEDEGIVLMELDDDDADEDAEEKGEAEVVEKDSVTRGQAGFGAHKAHFQPYKTDVRSDSVHLQPYNTTLHAYSASLQLHNPGVRSYNEDCQASHEELLVARALLGHMTTARESTDQWL